MRSLISSFIILFTLVNFTYASLEISDLSSHCVKEVKGTDLECHSRAEKEEDSHTEGDCHCDCHIGHLHSALILDVIKVVNKNYIQYKIQYPFDEQLNLQVFYSRINRPPIA